MLLLTLLTLTYKRPFLIERLYKSIYLSNLDKDLFEWIIFIDGRKENLETIEKVIKWKLDNKIRIRFFIMEENQGLSKTLNHFNKIDTNSHYTMRVDDDDLIASSISHEIISLLNEFKNNNKIGFILNMVDHNQKLIGTLLPRDSIPRTNFYLHYYFKVKGDKTRIYPTNVIKKYSYTLFNNEKFVPDSQIYYEMDSVLKLIPVNFSPIIREYLPTGLTKNHSKVFQNNIQSILYSNMQLMNHYQARLLDKILIFLKSTIIVIKTQKYRMINKIKPNGINWLIFIFLYPIYKMYILLKIILKTSEIK